MTQVCAEFHAIRFFIAISTVVWVLQNIGIGYWQWKIKTSVLAQKSLAGIDRTLPKIQSNLICRASIAQPTICCRIDSGINLIAKFPNYHCCWSQCICYITIDVCSCEHGAEKILSLSNIQQMSSIQQWELLMHTYIHLQNQSWQSAAQLRLWSAVYQRWQCYKYTCKITVEKNDRVAIVLMILHHNVKVTYSINIGLLTQKTTSTAQV